jgi:hypothetical protein
MPVPACAVVVEEPPEQGATAVHLQLAARLGLQLAMGSRNVTVRTVVFAHPESKGVVDARSRLGSARRGAFAIPGRQG